MSKLTQEINKAAKITEVKADAVASKAVLTQKSTDKIEQIENPTLWGHVKDFFKRSETIFLARLEVLVGITIAAFGAIDFSPLFSLFGETAGFTSKQAMAIGGISIVKGFITEIARRRNSAL